MNVLKAPFNTRYETAPFSKIRNIDFIPAFEKAIAVEMHRARAFVCVCA